MEKPQGPRNSESLPCVLAAGTNYWAQGFVPAGGITMLMTKERRPAIRTLRGWAISILQKPAPSASARSTAG